MCNPCWDAVMKAHAAHLHINGLSYHAQKNEWPVTKKDGMYEGSYTGVHIILSTSNCIFVSALSMNLNNLISYAFSPAILVKSFVKLRQSKSAILILIVLIVREDMDKYVVKTIGKHNFIYIPLLFHVSSAHQDVYDGNKRFQNSTIPEFLPDKHAHKFSQSSHILQPMPYSMGD